MTLSEVRELSLTGLWRNNPALVQVLGLCPLLAVTGTMVNGLGLGIATLFVLLVSNLSVSLIRRFIRDEIRIPIFVLVIASAVTLVELLMRAYLHDLYRVLGIFIPLIVTNCAIIGRAEAYASRNGPALAVVDALAMGTGFLLVLVVLGGMRELLGFGTLMRDAHLLFGEGAGWMTLNVLSDYRGFLLAILPPGAFIGMGLLVAFKNLLDETARRRGSAPASATQLAESS